MKERGDYCPGYSTRWNDLLTAAPVPDQIYALASPASAPGLYTPKVVTPSRISLLKVVSLAFINVFHDIPQHEARYMTCDHLVLANVVKFTPLSELELCCF